MADLVYRDDWSEVWHASCLYNPDVEEILGDRRPDAAIFDAPHSVKTHEGHEKGRLSAEQLASYASRRSSGATTREVRYAARKAKEGKQRSAIEYAAWGPIEVERFVRLWSPIVAGWIVSITDGVLAPIWEDELGDAGRCAFSPFPFVELGRNVRRTGDGPANWGSMVVAARPREGAFTRWGSLPGAYVVPGERAFNSTEGSLRIAGGKPFAGMLQIVRDYSDGGDLVIDQACGSGTTLAAAKRLGRQSIGIDRDRETCLVAAERLRRTNHQPGLLPERRRGTKSQSQGVLFGDSRKGADDA